MKELRQRLRFFGDIVKVILFLAIILSLVGLSLSCKPQTTPTPSPSASASLSQGPQKNDLTNLDPSSVKEEMRSNFNLAKQKAALWIPDATLFSSSAKITSSLDFQDVVEVYTYGSNSQPSYWWTISISERSKNYIRAIIPKEDYLGSSLKAVAMGNWKINYIEAFQVAEKNGGKEWREKQTSQNYQITATLAMGDPNNLLYWTVEYQNSDGSDKKAIQVDANSGEAVGQND